MNQLEKFSHASLEHLGLRMKHYEAPNKTHYEANNIIEYMVAHLESLLISQVMSNLKVSRWAQIGKCVLIYGLCLESEN